MCLFVNVKFLKNSLYVLTKGYVADWGSFTLLRDMSNQWSSWRDWTSKPSNNTTLFRRNHVQRIRLWINELKAWKFGDQISILSTSHYHHFRSDRKKKKRGWLIWLCRKHYYWFSSPYDKINTRGLFSTASDFVKVHFVGFHIKFLKLCVLICCYESYFSEPE